MRIELPSNKEIDIDLVFPSGEIIQLQYRLEAPSIDVCMPTELQITNWEGDDMKPAPISKWTPEEHVRMAKQLVIDFPEEWLGEPD